MAASSSTTILPSPAFLVPEQAHDLNADLPLIAKGLHMDVDQLQSTLNHFRHQPKYQPIPLKQDITPDELAFIAAHNNELPELEIIEEQRRLYPSNGFLAHLIGYVGEVSEEMLDDPRYASISPAMLSAVPALKNRTTPFCAGRMVRAMSSSTAMAASWAYSASNRPCPENRSS